MMAKMNALQKGRGGQIFERQCQGTDLGFGIPLPGVGQDAQVLLNLTHPLLLLALDHLGITRHHLWKVIKRFEFLKDYPLRRKEGAEILIWCIAWCSENK